MASRLPRIKESIARRLLPRRMPDSYKGKNGRVLIIGGSIDYYGAPILAGLGALYSGADLVYLYVPGCNFECTRSLYPDFIVKQFPGKYFNEESVQEIAEFGKKCDCMLIGPGLGKKEETLTAVKSLMNKLPIPTVLDANAIAVIKKITKFPLQQTIVITPHHGEFLNLVDREMKVKEDDPRSIIFLRSISMDLHINVVLKGQLDFVASYEGNVEVNETGNAGMTVGGSGDVLAGMVASFIAQGCEAFDAARCATYFNGKAGDLLFKQKGVNFSASDLAISLPYVLR